MDELLIQALLLSALAVGLLQIIKVIRPKQQQTPPPPPGPWSLPVIGSMHHLIGVLPHHALRRLAAAHGPLMMLRLGATPLVVVSSREVAREVLKTHDANFATRPRLLAGEVVLYGCADILFSPSGEYWRKLRQLCSAELLGPKRVLSFRHIREQEMASRVEGIRAAGPLTPVDVGALFYDLAISIISCASFGKKQRNADEYLAAVKTGVSLASGFKIPDLFPKLQAVLAAVTGMRETLEDVHKTIDSTLEEVIEERRGKREDKGKCGIASNEENFVDVLIGLNEKGGHLREDSIKAVIFDMFTAGTGTLASSLNWGVSELMRNPRVMNKLQGEIREAFHGKSYIGEDDIQASNLPYLRLFIKETLRLHPPAPLLVPRESIDACEVNGYMILAGSRIVINVWAIGRDPKYWGDAEVFRPERFDGNPVDFIGNSYEFLPFGAGRRMCPGITYALPVLEMTLVQLLYHFDWALPEGVIEVDMEEEPGLSARRKAPLLLCATPFVVPISMDELFYQALLLSALAVAALQIVKAAVIRAKNSATGIPPPPPGPWRLPVIGSMHHLIGVLPHRALRDLAAAHGPLMMLRLGETPLVVVSSRETAREVLRTHDANFATRPRLLAGEVVLYGCADILFSPSGDYWRKLRQLCAAEVLGPRRVRTFRRIREQEMASRVEMIRAAGPLTPVNVSAMLYELTNSIASCISFGKKLRNADEYLLAIKTGISLASGFKIPDLFPSCRTVLAEVTGMRRALEDVHRIVDSTLEEVIEERRGEKEEKARCGMEDTEENFVDVLINLHEKGGHLSRDSVKAVIFDMFTAGTGTIGSSLNWGMTELMRNPRVMTKLQGEIRKAFHGKVIVGEDDIQTANIPYLRLFIKETLRLHPAVPLLVPRESFDTCEVNGYTIPAGSRVVVNAWAIGRDPKYWDNPEEFKPERFEGNMADFSGSSYEYLPFGAGRRICPGVAYGLPVLEMVIVQLLYNFDWSLPNGVTEVDMEEEPGLGARRKAPLLLCATPFVVPLFYKSLLLSVLAVALLQIIKVFLVRSAKPAPALLPPGPWRLPVISSMHHLAGRGALPRRGRTAR
uniref:Cytochrome P450 n=1 Tax=Leersia perrieri TaxID=77586 RepID=A0A0D9VDS7_9ORYZ